MTIAVEFRALRPQEEAAVLRLWIELLVIAWKIDWEPRVRLFRDSADEPFRFARTYVAVNAGGTILSVASYA